MDIHNLGSITKIIYADFEYSSKYIYENFNKFINKESKSNNSKDNVQLTIEYKQINEILKNKTIPKNDEILVVNSLFKENLKQSNKLNVLNTLKNLLDDNIRVIILASKSFSELIELYEEEHNNRKAILLLVDNLYHEDISLDEQKLGEYVKYALKTKQIVVDKIEYNYFVHMNDLFKAILTASQNINHGGIFFVAEPYSYSNYAIYLRLSVLLSKDIQLNAQVSQEDTVKSLPNVIPDWKADISLDTGLELILNRINTSSDRAIFIDEITAIENEPIRNYTPAQRYKEKTQVSVKNIRYSDFDSIRSKFDNNNESVGLFSKLKKKLFGD